MVEFFLFGFLKCLMYGLLVGYVKLGVGSFVILFF